MRCLLYLVVFFHLLLVSALAAACFVALWLSPAHEAFLLIVLSVGWLWGGCPLTSLENYVRIRSGLPRVRGFTTHYAKELAEHTRRWWQKCKG